MSYPILHRREKEMESATSLFHNPQGLTSIKVALVPLEVLIRRGDDMSRPGFKVY